jgi:hypothetical protein
MLPYIVQCTASTCFCQHGTLQTFLRHTCVNLFVCTACVALHLLFLVSCKKRMAHHHAHPAYSKEPWHMQCTPDANSSAPRNQAMPLAESRISRPACSNGSQTYAADAAVTAAAGHALHPHSSSCHNSSSRANCSTRRTKATL